MGIGVLRSLVIGKCWTQPAAADGGDKAESIGSNGAAQKNGEDAGYSAAIGERKRRPRQ